MIVTIYHIVNLSLWRPVVFLRFWSFPRIFLCLVYFSIIIFERFVGIIEAIFPTSGIRASGFGGGLGFRNWSMLCGCSFV